ncbi:MAG: putative DNA-binding domain-containing protein [Pseudomonadota bacterium]
MSFTAYQTAFAARIRDPRATPLPAGAPARRMRVYQELLYNNLEGFLLACYPVTRKLLGARAWKRTVRRFFAGHRCHSPLFRDIPKAFLDWMQTRHAELFPDLPFLPDFMHYEWLELSVSVAPEEANPDTVEPDGDLLQGHPALNPTARLACYRYPVHRIGPRFKPHGPADEHWYYLLHRDAEHVVRFTVLNPASARLVELIRDTRLRGHEALAKIATELNYSQPDVLIEAGLRLLHEMRRSGALLGAWRSS